MLDLKGNKVTYFGHSAFSLTTPSGEVPMHYATFPFLTGTPEALREETKDIAELQIHALKPGESL
jgi:L-ascorbate metabolism protein UlaG (beta-lactamase superfamily)